MRRKSRSENEFPANPASARSILNRLSGNSGIALEAYVRDQWPIGGLDDQKCGVCCEVAFIHRGETLSVAVFRKR